jgi:hypothetical protein
MKYLVLVYGSTDPSPDSEENVAMEDGLMAFKDELAGTGELVSSVGLGHPEDGRVVQVRDGVKVVTDGPFAEGKDQLAAYFMIEVSDDERAQQVAARVAAVINDRVELRETVLTGP